MPKKWNNPTSQAIHAAVYALRLASVLPAHEQGEPEHELWFHVITQAIHDLYQMPKRYPGQTFDAWQWFFSLGHAPFAHLVGLDEEFVLLVVRKLANHLEGLGITSEVVDVPRTLATGRAFLRQREGNRVGRVWEEPPMVAALA